MTKPKLKVKKGDTVLVARGKSAGKKGKVLEVDLDKRRVIVEGLNIVKKHTKPVTGAPQGGIVEKEASMHSSNVMLVCSACSQPTRIGRKKIENGKLVRYCKKCGAVLDK